MRISPANSPNPTLLTVNPFCVAVGVRNVREVASFVRTVSLREPIEKIEMRPGVVYQVATGVSVPVTTKIRARPIVSLFLLGVSVDRIDAGVNGEILLYVTTRAVSGTKLGGPDAQFELQADEPFEGATGTVAEPVKHMPPPVQVVDVPQPIGSNRRPMGAPKMTDAQMAEKFMQEGEDAAATVVQVPYSPVATLARRIDPLTGIETQVDPASRVGVVTSSGASDR